MDPQLGCGVSLGGSFGLLSVSGLLAFDAPTALDHGSTAFDHGSSLSFQGPGCDFAAGTAGWSLWRSSALDHGSKPPCAEAAGGPSLCSGAAARGSFGRLSLGAGPAPFAPGPAPFAGAGGCSWPFSPSLACPQSLALPSQSSLPLALWSPSLDALALLSQSSPQPFHLSALAGFAFNHSSHSSWVHIGFWSPFLSHQFSCSLPCAGGCFHEPQSPPPSQSAA
mmetsp:Transcript_13790/g.36440  ORF Transcript_13790/g.36440 Transcript_13790/m.36440 type:complete len:223 (-) Transcript_13790:110-778(-)